MPLFWITCFLFSLWDIIFFTGFDWFWYLIFQTPSSWDWCCCWWGSQSSRSHASAQRTWSTRRNFGTIQNTNWRKHKKVDQLKTTRSQSSQISRRVSTENLDQLDPVVKGFIEPDRKLTKVSESGQTNKQGRRHLPNNQNIKHLNTLNVSSISPVQNTLSCDMKQSVSIFIISQKHCKNCDCCPVSLIIVR